MNQEQHGFLFLASVTDGRCNYDLDCITYADHADRLINGCLYYGHILRQQADQPAGEKNQEIREEGERMTYEMAYLDGKLYLTFKDAELVKKLMGCVDDMAKSELFNGHRCQARDLLDFYLELEEAYEEMNMEVEEDDPLRS